MEENAELYRTLKEEFRPQRLGFWLAIYGAMVGCILMMMATEYREGVRLELLASNFLAGLVTFHFVASIGLSLLRSGSAIAREREMSTLDFQRLTSATSEELALGKLLGSTLSIHMFNALALAMALPAALLAHLSLIHTLFIFALLTVSTLFYGALGLMISAGHKKADIAVRSALGMGGILTALCAAATGSVLEALTPLPSVCHFFNVMPKSTAFWIPLAGTSIPIEVVTFFFYIAAGSALMAGTARQLANPDAPPWSRGQLLGLSGAGLTFLFAFLFSHPSSRYLTAPDLSNLTAVYESTVLACLVIGALVLTPSRSRLVEEVWRGPASAREMLLGERGSGLPFLAALTLLAYAIPFTGLFLRYSDASSRIAHVLPLVITGFALTLLALKFCTQSALWLSLNLDFGRVVSALGMLFAVAFGPLLLGLMFIDSWHPWMLALLASNPPVVLFTLAQSRPPVPPQAMATASILLFTLLSAMSCALASRKLAALTVQVEAKRRSLHEPR